MHYFYSHPIIVVAHLLSLFWLLPKASPVRWLLLSP